MSRNKVPRGDGVHSELDTIQRRFRDMEAKHRLSNDDSIQTIRMQRSKIEKLKTDNERLKEEIALENKQQSSRSTSSSSTAHHQDALSNHPTALAESAEMYFRKIEIEKKRIAELDLQIKKMEESILQQRSDMGGINANRETSKTIQKNIRMLENRLDKALVKYNEALGHNKKLRGTIDNLRRERIVFDGIYKKLENDLLTIKNEMASIIGDANTAYIQRDYAQSEMVRMKHEADNEQKQFEHKWKELTTLIDADQKMKDFLTHKDGDNANDSVVTSVLEQEQNLRKKLSKGAWQIVKDKAHIHMAQEKVKAYKESFDKISNATNIDDIDTLVHTFISAEHENFKLFNQVNKLSNDIERIDQQILNTQKEIDLMTGQDQFDDDAESAADHDDDAKSAENADQNQRQIILKELKQKIRNSESKTVEYKNKYQESLRTMSSLKDGIWKILQKVGVDNTHKPMMEMIKNTGVTESNVMEVLGIIEQKTNALVSNYLSVAQNKQNESDLPPSNITAEMQCQVLDDKQAEAASLGIGIGAASLQPLVATPASIFDDFSDEEEDDQALPQEQHAHHNQANVPVQRNQDKK